MKTHLSVAAAGLLGVTGAAAAATHLTVTFVEPQNYTDVGHSSAVATERDRADVDRALEKHLQTLAERGLQPSETLKIEILDIDLAGRFEPFRFRSGADVRIVRDITWPRIKLRYALSRDGQVVASREEQLADLNFLTSMNRYSSSDRLRYEKAMLDDWFEKRIVKRD